MADGACEATIEVGTGEVGTDPGGDIAEPCKKELEGMLKEPSLIPIFSSSIGTGKNAVYTIYGFAAFQVTGWKFPSVQHPDPLAPACTGNCRGFMGYFTRYVTLEEGLQTGSGPNLGATAVRLTN